MLKCLIFDMDGTIVDSIPFHKKSWEIFSKTYPINNLEEKLTSQNKGGTITEIMKFLMPEHKNNEGKIQELGNLKESIFRKIYKPYVKPLPGFIKFIQNAKINNLSINLASNGDHNNIKFIVECINCDSYFNFKIGSNDVKKGKPNPEMFLKIIKKINVLPKECLIFEDSIEGVEAGLKSGSKVVGVTTTHSKDKLISLGCSLTIDNYDDDNLLIKIIDKLFK